MTPLPAHALGNTAAVTGALALLTALFHRLRAEEIRYCLWKSNEHLQASLRGVTDLDVLVHRQDARRLARLLTELDFKPFRKLTGHEYPGIEDYLGFDGDTGSLSHLHVHYQLTLGEKFLKGYRLPWECGALATRMWDAEHGAYVIDPHLEAVLLVIRAALKLRARDYVLAVFGYAYLRNGALRELRWLASRVDTGRLRALAGELLGDRAGALLCEIVATPAPSIRQLLAFRRSAGDRLDAYRMYRSLDALRQRWTRELTWIWTALTNRMRGLKQRSTRTAPRGGLAVCVTGQRTTASVVARQLVAWLAPEMAVVPDSGPRFSAQARQARGRGLVVVADRHAGHSDDDRPDLILHVDDESGEASRAIRAGGVPTIRLDARAAPATLLLQAKHALWESL